MKKYNRPEAELLSFAATDVIMASDEYENETGKDYIDNTDLTITDIRNI